MRKRIVRRWLCTLAMVATLVPTGALAQDAESVRRELEAMRQQFDTMKQQYERRLQELADRLQTLEAQKPMPAPAVPTAPGAPAAAPTPSTPPAPSVADLLRPREPFALAQPGRQLLFDIGVSGDFVADFTSNQHDRRNDGTFNGRENRVIPRELSLGVFGRVDPYASAVFRITGAEEEPAPGAEVDTEVTARVEEVNVTLLTLPLGTTARFGLMRPRFGTLNLVHEDDLPQVDRPDVLRRFFGQEEINTEKGLELMWLLPTPFYQELSIGAFTGDNDVAWGRKSIRDPLVIGRLRSFFELEDFGGLQVDLSGATGRDDDDRRNTVAGLGLKYKWSPLVGYAFPVITLAGEAIYGNRTVEEDVGGRRLERWGYYVYGQYDWSKRWAAGLRYDWTEFPTTFGHAWALAPYLQFKPSEFLRFRAEYKRTDGTGSDREADELFIQGSFIMGAHPTERF